MAENEANKTPARPACCAAPDGGKAPLGAMFLRSFFLQAAWNYERFQNFGFCFALEPALRRFYPDPERLKEARRRHLQIVNTQPYMASFVLGNVARLEESAAAAADPAPALKSMAGVKQALATSFAAIGDRIFWGRLKPMTAEICLLVWAAGGFYGWLFPEMDAPVSVWLLMAGPLAGILVYSAVSVYTRWRGLEAGYRCGGSPNCALDAANWPRHIKLLSAAGFVMALALAMISFGVLAGASCLSCSPGRAALKIALPVAVLGLHRLCRAAGKSVFFAVGVVLAASLLVFSIFGVEPFRLYL